MAETEGHAFSRPGGTRAGAGDNPALKRRAIVALSLRDEAGATPETATGTGALPSNVPVGGRAQAPANGSLGWTNGARGVWSSQRDALTIARHFNAGFNPQMIQVPQGRPTFANRNYWQLRKPKAMRSAVPVGLWPVPATTRR
jgi:hypothetical protein